MKLKLTLYLFLMSQLIFAQSEQLLLNENFQTWTAASASATETTKSSTTMYGEAITYKWTNCTIMPTYVAKSDNGVTTAGAIQTNKVDPTLQYFVVTGFANVTRAIFKHSYTGGTRGCIISVKGDGDADWVQLFNANTTAAGGQSTEIAVNRTNVSLRFQGNGAANNAYLHDLLVYGNTTQIVPTITSIVPATNSTIPVSGAITVTFSENVTRGTGDITLGGVAIPESAIQIANNVVTIQYSGLSTDNSYGLSIPAGAFKNSANTPTAAVTTASYKTPDTVVPSLTKMSITNGAILPINGYISLVMSEACKAGTATISVGNREITAAISASNSNLVYINFSGLAFDTDYNVTIPANAITDLAGNSYAGTTISFHTEVDAKGAQYFSYTPDATSMPSTATGTVTQTINGKTIEFGSVTAPGARAASPYTYAFKCNYVLLPELPSVGEISFYAQCGGGTGPQEYYIQKLAADGTTWNTIETIIFGNNDKNTIKSAAAQSSAPTRLRLMFNSAPLWFYNIDVSAFALNTPVDDGQNPQLSTSTPANNATDIAINGNLKLVFSENVVPGSGAITLDGKTLTPSVVGKNITLPYANLKYATNYTLNVAAGAFKDLFNNDCAAFTINFTTKAKPSVTPKVFDFVVAQDGSGNGTTIQSAFNAVPLNNTAPFLIYVKNGTYAEYPTLADTKNSVSLIGQSKNGVMITGNRRSGVDGFSTSTCQTVEILADNFYCENITLQNTAGVDAGQAVALKVYADKAVFKNVKLVGYQDTHLTANVGSDRQYYLNCDIRGSVDFIFGNGVCFFDECLLYVQDRATGNVVTAPSTDVANSYGYVFNNCTIDGAGSQDGIYSLGRPWQNAPRVVYLNTKMNILPAAAGWANMSTIPAIFAEYNSVNAANSPIDLSNRTTSFSYTANNVTTNGSTPYAVLPSSLLPNYSLSAVLTGADSWDPTVKPATTAAPANVAINGNTLAWDVVDGAICYIVTNNGTVASISTTPSFTLSQSGSYNVVAVSEFGALSAASSINYLPNGIVGVNSEKVTGKLAHQLLLLKGLNGNSTVELFDLTGKKLNSIFTTNNTLVIPINAQFVVVKITSDQQTVTLKVVAE